MRTLYLLRHAKSSWKDASLPDFDRPLNSRGREAAALVGKYLANNKIKFSSVVCSPALRTRETIDLVLKTSGIQVPVDYDDRIYEADVGRLVSVIKSIDDEETSVLLVGHNPGIQDLLAALTSEYREMKTAALAKLTFETSSWQGIKAGVGRLESFTTPKELAD
jgi:phosphohistidine phosphatase